MDIQLPASEQVAAEELVASGRFASVEEVVIEGIRRLIASERIREQVQEGIQQADHGELVEHDALFSQLRLSASTGNYESK